MNLEINKFNEPSSPLNCASSDQRLNKLNQLMSVSTRNSFDWQPIPAAVQIDEYFSVVNDSKTTLFSDLLSAGNAKYSSDQVIAVL